MMSIMLMCFILVMNVIILYRIHTDQKVRMASLEKEHHYDLLTQAYTRRYGLEKLDKLCQKMKSRKHAMTVCFIDVNDLKQVNDSYGHSEGDRMLKTVCDKIKDTIHVDDFVIRYGGDEFLLVLAHSDGLKAMSTMTRINQKLGGMTQSYGISIAYGIEMFYTNKDCCIDTIIAKADLKMYENKMSMKTEQKAERSAQVTRISGEIV